MVAVRSEELRALAKLLEAKAIPGAVLCIVAASEIDRLEAECSTLAAGVCEWRGGNEHGNAICMQSGILIEDFGPVDKFVAGDTNK